MRVKRLSKIGLVVGTLAVTVISSELPFLVDPSESAVGQSSIDQQRRDQEARDRALGDQRPGQQPPEAVQGSSSGTTVGRADNPWGTRGKPLRGDEWD